MKKIFKKNQIIITALAIMILVAGYLNFSQRDTQDDTVASDGQVLDYDEAEKTVGDNLDDSDLLEFLNEGKDIDDLVNEDGADDVAENIDADQVQDVSDTGEIITENEDDLAAAETVSGEVKDEENDEETPPGEAVLVSTKASPDYFLNARLSREQMRASNKDTLMEILENTTVSEEDKSLATQEIIKLTSISEKENATETLLEAKGYSDAVVRLSEEKVNVIINAASLDDQDIAQIEDIVKRETGFEVTQIVIAPVIVSE